MRFEKVSTLLFTVIICVLCVVAMLMGLWSYFYLPDTPLRDPTPTLISGMTVGSTTAVIGFGTPLVLILAAVTKCWEIWHRKEEEDIW